MADLINKEPIAEYEKEAGSAVYKQRALASAHSSGLTPAMVRALDYRQTAAICGVAIGPNGESPRDFFYQNHRRHLANKLQEEVDAAERQATIETMNAALATRGKRVVEQPGGRLKIEDLPAGKAGAVVEAKK